MQTRYINFETTNQSFIDMHNYLKSTGIDNNDFFLTLYDANLLGVDPRDPLLTREQKARIARECIVNYWYFLREVVRIPDQGGAVASGVRYKLHRGNLALNYLFILNYNIFLELPRQHGKTTAALIRYLWVYNFGTSNSEIMFANKKHDDSKRALADLKKYRDVLPSYLQMSESYGRDGRKIKVHDNATFLENSTNGNKIRTAPGARTKQLANNLGRGCTMPLQYYDEFAWILYNKEIYMAAVPAFSTASKNAKRNGSPYGILITTTPGDLTTNEGLFAFTIRNNATKWNEKFYDYTYDQMEEVRTANTNSTFFYVSYTYQQLGSGEEYFKQMVVDLNQDWDTIKREVLLQWTTANMNCPFSTEDLDIIKSLAKQPIRTMMLGKHKQYQFNVFKDLDLRYPPIIGVDVAAGYQKDASAITIIDSKTTEVCATFNCNYISSPDLARLIYELVTEYMPNAIINIERNGGFGGSVLATLAKTSIKKNLYYEYKDRILEERPTGPNQNITKVKKNIKVYGTDNTKDTRNKLIELLFERVELHKDKFNALILHDEMEQMETKPNGKIEHSSNSHDDQVFSYLMALYVWYFGEDIKRRYNLIKMELKTDVEECIEYMPIEDQYAIEVDLYNATLQNDDENGIQLKEQLEEMNKSKAVPFDDWIKSEREKDEAAYKELLQNPLTKQSVIDKFHLDPNEYKSNGSVELPEELFINFNNDYSDGYVDPYMQGNMIDEMNKIKDFR